MGVLNLTDIIRVLDYSAPPGAKGVMYVYRGDSDILATLYSDANLTFTTPNPTKGDPGGIFPEVFLSGGVYRVEVYDEQERVLLFAKNQVVINDKDTLGVNHGFYNMESLLRSRLLSYTLTSDLTRPARIGDIVFVADGSFTFQVVEGTDADYDMVTDGEVRLRALGTTLTPSQFGVVRGTGQTATVGERNVTQLNKMLARAASLGSKVYFPAGSTIEIANAIAPMKIPSKIAIEGNRCIIQAQNDEGPIIASAAWANNAGIGGNGHVDGLIARGTLTDTEINTGVGSPNTQDGIIVYDYFSHWTRCEAWRCRGRGIVAEESNSAGTPAFGSLVENRFEQCVIRNCAGRGFDFAPDALGKLTDGWLLDPIVGQPAGCTHEAISLNVASGWNVRGFHTYAGDPERAVVVARGYNTNIGDGYIETYTRTALHLPEAQQNISVGNIGVRSNKVEHPQASVIEVERSSSVTTANIKIQSIQDENNEGGAHALIRNLFGTSLPVTLGSFQTKGDNAGLVSLPNASDTWLSTSLQGIVLGRFTDTRAEHRLGYEGLQLMKGLQHQWSGSGAQSITFSIPYLSYYHTNRKMVCDLTIFSFQNHNMATRATYTAKLCIGGRDSGGPWKAILISTSTEAGFSVAPAVGAVTVTGEKSGTNPNGVDVTITFTATDSDGYGTASLLLGPTLGT